LYLPKQLTHPTYQIMDDDATSNTPPTPSFDISAPTDPSQGWTVKHVSGGDGTDAFALYLQDLLNRAIVRPFSATFCSVRSSRL
jgi:hypothetical protein